MDDVNCICNNKTPSPKNSLILKDLHLDEPYIVSFVLYQSLMYIDTIFYNKHDLYSLNSHQFDKILWLVEFERLIKCRLWRHEVARMRERISYQCFTITMLESIAHRMLHNLLCAKREPRGLLKGVSSSATTTWSILITLH